MRSSLRRALRVAHPVEGNRDDVRVDSADVHHRPSRAAFAQYCELRGSRRYSVLRFRVVSLATLATLVRLLFISFHYLFFRFSQSTK